MSLQVGLRGLAKVAKMLAILLKSKLVGRGHPVLPNTSLSLGSIVPGLLKFFVWTGLLFSQSAGFVEHV